MPNHRRQDRELDALYARLPAMHCQGYCSDSCGPIGMSIRERARIMERVHRPITCGKYATCSMLTDERKCGVYDIRPMICRLWGLVRSMPCPYGCRPEGGLLPDDEAVRMLVESDRIGGQADGAEVQRELEKALAAMSTEELRKRGRAIFAVSRPTVAGRQGALPPTILESTRKREFD